MRTTREQNRLAATQRFPPLPRPFVCDVYADEA